MEHSGETKIHSIAKKKSGNSATDKKWGDINSAADKTSTKHPHKKTGYDYFGNVAHIKRMPYPPLKEQSKKNTPKGRNRGKRQKTAKFAILPLRTTLDIPKDTKRQIRGGFKGRFSAISVKILPIRQKSGVRNKTRTPTLHQKKYSSLPFR